MPTSTTLITGASTGIGAIYAERLAQRGQNLVLVARNKAKLDELAERIRKKHGVVVDVLPADLTKPDDLAVVESRLCEDTKISTLINNTGVARPGTFLDQSSESLAQMIALNVTALTRLAAAIAPRLVEVGEGAIVNVGSVAGFGPEFGVSAYGATKAFVLFLSQGLSQELGPQGVYVQAVLPATTRTEIWEKAGIDINSLTEVMEAEDLVDAALLGFDRREHVTIPPLRSADRWETLDNSRRALISDLHQGYVADRYKA